MWSHKMRLQVLYRINAGEDWERLHRLMHYLDNRIDPGRSRVAFVLGA